MDAFKSARFLDAVSNFNSMKRCVKNVRCTTTHYKYIEYGRRGNSDLIMTWNVYYCLMSACKRRVLGFQRNENGMEYVGGIGR